MLSTARPALVPLIRRADAAARARFTYRHDPPGRDTWVSHADAVRAGRAWQGDCDDLGSTALELAIELGADPARLHRALVASPYCPPDQAFDHYVALAQAEDGDWWVFGDTYTPALPLAHSGHRVHASARIADGPHWQRWG